MDPEIDTKIEQLRRFGYVSGDFDMVFYYRQIRSRNDQLGDR